MNLPIWIHGPGAHVQLTLILLHDGVSTGDVGVLIGGLSVNMSPWLSISLLILEPCSFPEVTNNEHSHEHWVTGTGYKNTCYFDDVSSVWFITYRIQFHIFVKGALKLLSLRHEIDTHLSVWGMIQVTINCRWLQVWAVPRSLPIHQWQAWPGWWICCRGAKFFLLNLWGNFGNLVLGNLAAIYWSNLGNFSQLREI